MRGKQKIVHAGQAQKNIWMGHAQSFIKTGPVVVFRQENSILRLYVPQTFEAGRQEFSCQTNTVKIRTA